MDDVQQRRQRLAAMREQAALEDASDAIAASTTVLATSLNLPSPMIDTPPGDSIRGNNRASGFDFYTDPLTAFTSGKRRRAAGGETSQTSQIYQAPPPPAYNPPPAMQFPPPPPFSGNHMWQPVPYHPPPPPGGPGPPPQIQGQPGIGYSGQWNERGTEMDYENRGRVTEMGYGHRGRGTEMGYGNRGRGGRGHYVSDFYSQGRGNGSSNNTWNSGRGSGGNSFRGRGSQGRGGQRGGRVPSAKDQPHLYYKQSMSEDPWKELEKQMEEKKGKKQQLKILNDLEGSRN
ncbi:hypothetical protein R1flu_029178 [Riccia fluitans]|uniref:Uncharacterized protein n=1 Tax=Riccia fluitans TaxID=41844 RepID=A0ABD1XNU6_9MARC